ncbi:YecA family protein [Clostridium tertium]|uniref:YecA family protein n=1 Tax=Clostridium tertium TaxID=1559 RepID=UPI0034A18151
MVKKFFEELNKNTPRELENLFLEIDELITDINPINLIEYLSVISIFSKENYSDSNFLQISQLEYICGLMLKKKYNENNNNKIAPKRIQKIQDCINKFFVLWTLSDYYRRIDKTKSNEENEKNIMISSLSINYGIVRGDAFGDQIIDQMVGLFEKYDEWMMKNEGFTIREAILFFEKIKERYERLLNKCRNNIINSSEDMVNELINNKDNIKKKLPISIFKGKKKNLVQSSAAFLFDCTYQGTLTFTIESFCEEENITNVESFRKFIDRFSSEINKDLNKKFKYPSDNNIIRERPIMRYNDKYVVSNLSSLISTIQYEIENDMKKNKIWDKYQKNKGDYLENRTKVILEQILPSSKSYESLFYDFVDNTGEVRRCELDLLLVYDNKIFLVESKSGLFHTPARRGALKKLENNIKENIEYAFEQASRAKQYINDNKEAIFYDENGNKVVEIRGSDYSEIFIINTTMENFGEVATSINKFKQMGLYNNDEYPWSVNINDLDIIKDFIEYPFQFIHYIHRRLKINNRSNEVAEIKCNDELDLFINYLQNNLYYDDCEEYNLVMIPDSSEIINEYYLSKNKDLIIKQNIDNDFKRMLIDIEKLNTFGYTDIIVALLELDGFTRNEIIDNLKLQMERTKVDKKIHDVTSIVLNNPNDKRTGIGVTIFTALSSMRADVVKRLDGYCRLKKYQQKSYEWIGICKFIDDPLWSINEVMYFKWEEEQNLHYDKLVKENLTKPLIWANKVGRNDMCPCGSGIKFKKCHGKN